MINFDEATNFEELPREVKDFLNSLKGKATVIKIENNKKKNDNKNEESSESENLYIESGKLLSALEGIKFTMAGQIPEKFYLSWLCISTHLSAAFGILLKDIFDQENLKKSRATLNRMVKEMYEFLKFVEDNYDPNHSCEKCEDKDKDKVKE